MSILDDAIREHLELKRAHGADESELKKLEDEAFGPPDRPDEIDPFAEAPTEFLTAPEGLGEGPDDVSPEAERRRVNVADLQEPPPPVEAAPEEGADRDQQEEEDPAPEPTAMEHEVIPEPPPIPEPDAIEAGPSTEEREAIAEQPTELFDVEAEIGSQDEPLAEAPSPSDEEIADEELAEPRLASGGPAEAAPAEELEDEEDDDFWSDQRLSDELDQALEAPLEERSGEEADEQHGEHDAVAPHQEPEPGHEDVLEDTPDFLEDAPEDDELWFEQRPPKDFDFDD